MLKHKRINTYTIHSSRNRYKCQKASHPLPQWRMPLVKQKGRSPTAVFWSPSRRTSGEHLCLLGEIKILDIPNSRSKCNENLKRRFET